MAVVKKLQLNVVKCILIWYGYFYGPHRLARRRRRRLPSPAVAARRGPTLTDAISILNRYLRGNYLMLTQLKP